MLNYDFLNLSPLEFEGLTRDLLQLQFGVHLESFGQGQDQGIDLRCSSCEEMIIQCKRYTDFDPLISALKEEVGKVVKLNPKRYIIATSVSLSPTRKQKILSLFSPYLQGPADIYGREDLNNLLTRFPNVERDNFKLWLSGTHILSHIINTQITNQSKFTLEDIKQKIKIYVQNASFTEASDILEKNNYVIISGIPGIGKTTLAEILVYDRLATGFEEFIYLSESISEGFQVYDESRSQIFLFDDFLGSNFLQNSIQTNEEKQLIKFIEKIEKSTNKLLIFTTREYVLNQAKARFEVFENKDFAKSIIDLSKYTTVVKAQILYNHLYFNKIPYPYIDEIIRRKYLLRIIEHKNYSPRIIEYLSYTKLWEKHSVQDFPDVLISMFNSPFKVWEHAFENQISELSRAVLVCILMCDPQPDYDLLFIQVKKYINTSAIPITIHDSSFKSALKELDNSFLTTTRNSTNKALIKYHNPSIRDFMISYLQKLPTLQMDLIHSSLWLKPLVMLFSTKGLGESYHSDTHKKVFQALEDKIVNDFFALANPMDSSIEEHTNELELVVKKLTTITTYLEIRKQSKLFDFIKETFSAHLYPKTIDNAILVDFTKLLVDFFRDEPDVRVNDFLLAIIPSILHEDDLEVFNNIEEAFPEQFKLFKEEFPEYHEAFANIISDKIDIDLGDLELLRQKIEELQGMEDLYEVDTQEERELLEKIIEKRTSDEAHYNEMWEHPQEPNYALLKSNRPVFRKALPELKPAKVLTEEEKIENIFRSLKLD